MKTSQKKIATYAGLAVVGAVAVYFFTINSTSKEAPLEPLTTSLTGNVDTRVVTLEAIADRLQELEGNQSFNNKTLTDTVVKLQRSVADLGTGLSASIDRTTEPLTKQISLLNQRLQFVESALNIVQDQMDDVTVPVPVVNVPAEVKPKPPAPTPEQQAEPLYQPPPPLPVVEQAQPIQPAPAIRTVASEVPAPPEPQTLADTIPPLIIPAGSIITTVMLTGMDAPTGTRAQDNPIPVLMRIKRDAIMPNNFYADVVDCFLIGAGYGELSTERVNIRGEVATCTLSDGTPVEAKTKFWATGEDGKNGVRGVLVSRAGKALAASAAAGFADGISQAFGSTSKATSTINLGSLGQQGALSGSARALEKLSAYYLDLAEQTLPVIEITNGRQIDVILTQSLKINF